MMTASGSNFSDHMRGLQVDGRHLLLKEFYPNLT